MDSLLGSFSQFVFFVLEQIWCVLFMKITLQKNDKFSCLLGCILCIKEKGENES